MCKRGEVNDVHLCGTNRHPIASVDSCISDIVQALNDAKIKTIASCCGHGEWVGWIALEDGRHFDLFPSEKSWRDHIGSEDRKLQCR